MTRDRASVEKETNSSSCLENSQAVNNSDVTPADFVTKEDVSSSSCPSEVTDYSPLGSVTKEKHNTSSAESTEDDLTSGRHCVEAYPGHKKNKRILEVKENSTNNIIIAHKIC